MSCYPTNNCPDRDVAKSCNNTDDVIYTGEDLPCLGVNTGDTLTEVLQKINEKFCELSGVSDDCQNPFFDILTK